MITNAQDMNSRANLELDLCHSLIYSLHLLKPLWVKTSPHLIEQLKNKTPYLQKISDHPSLENLSHLSTLKERLKNDLVSILNSQCPDLILSLQNFNSTASKRAFSFQLETYIREVALPAFFGFIYSQAVRQYTRYHVWKTWHQFLQQKITSALTATEVSALLIDQKVPCFLQAAQRVHLLELWQFICEEQKDEALSPQFILSFYMKKIDDIKQRCLVLEKKLNHHSLAGPLFSFATRMLTKQSYYRLGEALGVESMLCLQAYRSEHPRADFWILDESWNAFLSQSAGVCLLGMAWFIHGYQTLISSLLHLSLCSFLPPSNLVSYLLSYHHLSSFAGYELHAISIINQCYQWMALGCLIVLQSFSENHPYVALVKWSLTYVLISFLQSVMQQAVENKLRQQGPQSTHALNIIKILSQFTLQLGLMWLFPQIWHHIASYFQAPKRLPLPEELLQDAKLCQVNQEECCLTALSVFRLNSNDSLSKLNSAFKNASRSSHPDLGGERGQYTHIINAKKIAQTCLRP